MLPDGYFVGEEPVILLMRVVEKMLCFGLSFLSCMVSVGIPGPSVRLSCGFFFFFYFYFFFFLIQFNVPFKIISAHMRRANE